MGVAILLAVVVGGGTWTGVGAGAGVGAVAGVGVLVVGAVEGPFEGDGGVRGPILALTGSCNALFISH